MNPGTASVCRNLKCTRVPLSSPLALRRSAPSSAGKNHRVKNVEKSLGMCRVLARPSQPPTRLTTRATFPLTVDFYLFNEFAHTFSVSLRRPNLFRFILPLARPRRRRLSPIGCRADSFGSRRVALGSSAERSRSDWQRMRLNVSYFPPFT